MSGINLWEFNLTADHVLKAQGSDPEIIRKRKPLLYEIAEWAVREGLPLLKPTVLQKVYRVGGLRHQKLEIIIDNSDKCSYLSGPLIAQHLAPAEVLFVVLCTIGDDLEQLAAELMATDPLYGWALDSFGSAAVESLTTQACNQIESQARLEGKTCSIPLSPGMIGWAVERGQEEIFGLIDASQIGIALNNNYQMKPYKSISLVIGVGHQMVNSGKTCDYCAMNSTCRYQNHYN